MASLVLLKPDVYQFQMIGKVLSYFDAHHIADMRMERMYPIRCAAHYHEHVDKDYYPRLQQFMCSGQVVALHIKDNWFDVRGTALMVRGHHQHLIDGPRNLVHASDSLLSAEVELNLWFPNRPVRWNPYSKVVCDHRTGTTYLDETNAVRESLGLPTPWTSALAEKECHQKPVFL